jgi:uncharacterized protein involved in response to NO
MPQSQITLLMRGFRPFFLGAALVAVLSMVMWMAVYRFQFPLELSGISMFQWHAHEMIFGYTMAVISGFLLTAARSWTGEETARGAFLGWLFLIWALARVLMLNGTGFLLWAAIADLLFMLGLGIAVARPILKVRQKRQAPVLLIVALLTLANLLFYLGAMGVVDGGTHLGLHGGLYLVLGIILFMGRRVIPLFTEKGLGHPVEIKNERWNDVATFILFPAFLLSEVFFQNHITGALLAAALFILNSLRVNGWHTLEIWQKPLLWGLFAAFMMINLGFMLRALMLVTAIPDFLPIHAFAVGGVGIITLSMMARVAIGHTGRNVHQAPPIMTVLLVSMVLTATIRIFLPMLDPSHYQFWITASGLMWIITFTMFAIVFIPLLVKPRVDGKEG